MSREKNLKNQLVDSRRLRLFVGVGLVLTLLLGACQAAAPAAAPVSTTAPTPMDTPVPADTPAAAPVSTTAPTPMDTPVPADTPAPVATEASPAGGEVQVKIINFAFDPSPLTVKAGDTVVWTNDDGTPHTVTADDGSFTSETLGKGETFSQTFSTPGEYPYYCKFHGGPGGSGMSGTVVVTE